MALLGAALFVAGFLLVPAVHSLELNHCDASHETESHTPESCAICAVAATSLVAPCVHTDILFTNQPPHPIRLPSALPSLLFIRDIHLARAPPQSA